MAGKPKVFVTRRLPAAGLDRILAACDAGVWPEPLPPPHELLLKRAADCGKAALRAASRRPRKE